jgi:SagB-type dehydrogenase family enzyme
MEENRQFLHFFDKKEYAKVVPESDESKNKPFPLFQKPFNETKKLIDLISPKKFEIGNISFSEVVNRRMSRRNYTDERISLEELSFLLWCTQGVKRAFKKKAGVMRTVPSAGAKSPFETYLVINRVEGIDPGLYRYISFDHKLLFIKNIENAEQKIGELAYDQKFVGKGAVVFCWVAIPYRTEWRYTILAHKFIAIDLGHVSQNLYLACEAINLGTVAVGYYEQKKFDALLELDGKDEFVVLIAPVGKIPII